MMLETVAGVPRMVGCMLLYLRSLRKFGQSCGWIKALLEEAENERMHLMTMAELVQPKWYERLLVLAVQGVFFNFYFVLYVLSPKLAHRIVGYLEEDVIHLYTLYLNDIDRGEIENIPAPAIAIDYWRLPKDATLKDVITVIRADEAHHRDVNHFASVIHYQGKKLQEAVALIKVLLFNMLIFIRSPTPIVDMNEYHKHQECLVLLKMLNFLMVVNEPADAQCPIVEMSTRSK